MGLLVDPPTGTILLISFFVKSSSSRTSGTGSRVSLNRSVFNFSDLALVRVSEKSSPPNEDSTSPQNSKENLGSLLRLGQDHDVFESCEGTEFCTALSNQSRPIILLASNTVFSGLVVSWFLDDFQDRIQQSPFSTLRQCCFVSSLQQQVSSGS